MPLDDMQRGIGVLRQSFTNGNPLDLVTTHLPSPVPAGLLTEVIRTDTLAGIHESTTTEEQCEHVTTVFYEHPEKFQIHRLETSLRALGTVHLSVDTERDQQLIGRIIKENPALDFSERGAAAAWQKLPESHPA